MGGMGGGLCMEGEGQGGTGDVCVYSIVYAMIIYIARSHAHTHIRAGYWEFCQYGPHIQTCLLLLQNLSFFLNRSYTTSSLPLALFHSGFRHCELSPAFDALPDLVHTRARTHCQVDGTHVDIGTGEVIMVLEACQRRIARRNFLPTHRPNNFLSNWRPP